MIHRNLVIDVGNTRSKWAVFESDSLVKSDAVGKFDLVILTQILSEYEPKNILLSNTGEVKSEIFEFLYQQNNFIYFDNATYIPIDNKYKTPKTLGKDRLAAAIGALKEFPLSNCLIIDMGTCITCDMVSKQGSFLGGNISPGINMRLNAMHQFTATLPKVEIGVPTQLFGQSTEHALQNGGVRGTFMELDTLILEAKSKFEHINVILTGGDAHLFEKYTKNEIFVVSNLVFVGLHEILKYNAK